MGKSSIFVVLCLLVVCSFLTEVATECCLATKNCVDNLIGHSCATCEDDTEGTPYCGYDSCNIFGCNCGGGCRVAARAALDERGSLQIDGYAKIDTNRDGKVSLEEAKRHIQSTGQNWEQEIHVNFAKMDTNFDGFLSMDEIDPVSKV